MPASLDTDVCTYIHVCNRILKFLIFCCNAAIQNYSAVSSLQFKSRQICYRAFNGRRIYGIKHGKVERSISISALLVRERNFSFENMAVNLQPSCCITAQQICRAYTPLFHRTFFFSKELYCAETVTGIWRAPVCRPLFPVFSVSRVMSRLCALMMTVLPSPSPLHKGTLLVVVLLFCFFT